MVLIDCRSIEYHHQEAGERTLLFKDLSFQIQANEKVVLLGVNGSGKTTLLRILNGLYHVHGGEYLYNGRKVHPSSLKNGSSRREFRKETALLFQNPDTMLFHSSVYDEIAYTAKALEMNDLDKRINEIAQLLAIQTLLERPPYRLSEGEKKRVCLAALLITEPKLLLLDEPLAGLDPPMAEIVMQILESLNITMVTVTHNMALIPRLGKRALVISPDHILAFDGPLHEFLEAPELMKKTGLL